MPTRAQLLCRIQAPDRRTASDLGAAARLCAARDAIALRVVTRTDPSIRETALTLDLPTADASTQHPAWCLACRLTALCPFSRVSLQVGGPAPATRRTPPAGLLTPIATLP